MNKKPESDAELNEAFSAWKTKSATKESAEEKPKKKATRNRTKKAASEEAAG